MAAGTLRLNLGDQRVDIVVAADAGKPGNGRIATGNDDFFAGFDFCEQLGEMRLRFSYFDGDGHYNTPSDAVGARLGPRRRRVDLSGE